MKGCAKTPLCFCSYRGEPAAAAAAAAAAVGRLLG